MFRIVEEIAGAVHLFRCATLSKFPHLSDHTSHGGRGGPVNWIAIFIFFLRLHKASRMSDLFEKFFIHSCWSDRKSQTCRILSLFYPQPWRKKHRFSSTRFYSIKTYNKRGPNCNISSRQWGLKSKILQAQAATLELNKYYTSANLVFIQRFTINVSIR